MPDTQDGRNWKAFSELTRSCYTKYIVKYEISSSYIPLLRVTTAWKCIQQYVLASVTSSKLADTLKCWVLTIVADSWQLEASFFTTLKMLQRSKLLLWPGLKYCCHIYKNDFIGALDFFLPFRFLTSVWSRSSMWSTVHHTNKFCSSYVVKFTPYQKCFYASYRQGETS